MASNVSVAAKILIMLRGFGFMRPGFEISLDPMSGRLIQGKKPALLSSPFGQIDLAATKCGLTGGKHGQLKLFRVKR